MKKELIGIIICTLLISVAVAPVINAFTNEINEVEEPPHPAEWPPYNEIIHKGFGIISNPKYYEGGWYTFWSFNCENVKGHMYNYDRDYYYWGHFTDNEVRYIIGDPWIVTKHFMYDPILPFHFYWIVE